MTVAEFNFNSITGNKETDQARALRVVVAALDDDFAQLSVLGDEVRDDPRGMQIALWELVVGMGVTVAREWVRVTGKEALRSKIQSVLLETEAKNG